MSAMSPGIAPCASGNQSRWQRRCGGGGGVLLSSCCAFALVCVSRVWYAAKQANAHHAGQSTEMPSTPAARSPSVAVQVQPLLPLAAAPASPGPRHAPLHRQPQRKRVRRLLLLALVAFLLGNACRAWLQKRPGDHQPSSQGLEQAGKAADSAIDAARDSAAALGSAAGAVKHTATAAGQAAGAALNVAGPAATKAAQAVSATAKGAANTAADAFTGSQAADETVTTDSKSQAKRPAREVLPFPEVAAASSDTCAQVCHSFQRAAGSSPPASPLVRLSQALAVVDCTDLHSPAATTTLCLPPEQATSHSLACPLPACLLTSTGPVPAQGRPPLPHLRGVEARGCLDPLAGVSSRHAARTHSTGGGGEAWQAQPGSILPLHAVNMPNSLPPVTIRVCGACV